MRVRRVSRKGALRWGSHEWVMVSTILIEKNVGLEEQGEEKEYGESFSGTKCWDISMKRHLEFKMNLVV